MIFELKKWGKIYGKNVRKFIVEDERTGFNVEISDLGATLLSVHVPDRKGTIQNITYGHESPEMYLKAAGYFGATIGRVANRMQNAQFELDGRIYKLTANHKVVHQLHGGLRGFDKHIWSIVDDETGIFEDEVRISLQYLSEEGEEGYPGNLMTNLIYRIKPMRIEWEFHATTDKATIVNLTNHAYWNLNGIHTLIDDMNISLYAIKYAVPDEDLIPSNDVHDFPIDLTNSVAFSTIFKTFGDLDHNFFLINYLFQNTALDAFPAAVLYSPITGRKMIIETSEPCIQVYSGNFMGEITSYGVPCKKHGAVCLETQRIPNAINMPAHRDSVILRPGEEYRHKTRHIFTIEK